MAQLRPGLQAGAGGDYNVSPASSIHRDREGHNIEGDPRLDYLEDKDLPTIAQSSRAAVDTASTTAASPVLGSPPIPGSPELWDIGVNPTVYLEEPVPPQTVASAVDNTSPTAPFAFGGSLVQRELAEARARANLPGHGPTITSYGPAPADEIRPAPPVQQAEPSSRCRMPFMHYQDIDYLDTDNEPKDEVEMTGLSRNDTLPTIPEGFNRKARRSWDRQRNRRRKKANPSAGAGGVLDGGAGEVVATRRGGFIGTLVAWAPEIFWLLLSILCFSAMIAVLRMYDGRGLPEWPLPISLNMLVAFMEAICRVSLVVPLTEGLAQLKWNWFARGQRPLADFETFDDVGRGPIANAKFILKGKGRFMGVSAAVALLTSFATSPLTQGTISYPTRSVAGTGIATAPRSELYSHSFSSGELDTRERQSVQLGIYHPTNEQLPAVPPICSSGDCQWSDFNSLAVCAATADITDKLSVSNETVRSSVASGIGLVNGQELQISFRNATLPSGAFLLGGVSTYNLNISAPLPPVVAGSQGSENFLPTTESLGFSKLDGRTTSGIANIFVVYTNQTLPRAGIEEHVFRAVEVLWHFCVNTYSATVTRGLSSTALVNSSTILSAASVADSASDAVVLRALHDDGEYVVRRDDVRQLNTYMSELFAGTYSYAFRSQPAGRTPTSYAFGSAMFESKTSEGLNVVYTEEELRAVIANMSGNIATSLTNS
ncbi:hypothetical protein QBC47DRAFT_296287 [Echria macrotheca]|uniref:Uncharacterized protein n=1 Tax=Echria macrotheca TaxID=438768 RepID=A0AAJ0BHP6_9PEZI|nr:hypothetical protein QBC47DRAFT_296287 [Echria macrotheca]